MIPIYIASGNTHKLAEIKQLTQIIQHKYDFLSAQMLGGMPAVDETAPDFAGNALLKAQSLLPLIPKRALILADDSGLQVDVLGGQPGVRSARYAGEDASDEQNNDKLLNELSGIPMAKRSAQFICCFVLIGGGIEQIVEGVCKGKIGFRAVGSNGFGYDPLFIPDGYHDSFAQLSASDKNQISHRALAVKKLLELLLEKII